MLPVVTEPRFFRRDALARIRHEGEIEMSASRGSFVMPEAEADGRCQFVACARLGGEGEHMKSLIVSLLVIAGLGASASVSSAGTVWEVYVSSTGTDTGFCLRTAPCATFAYAFTQALGNGIIHVVDQGNYGVLTITHGITIDGGRIASQTAAGGNAFYTKTPFTISAGASDVVTITGFTISGENPTSPGPEASAISVTSVGALHVEHCTFAGFVSAAIDFRATGGLLDMKDVTITDMPSGNGVYVANARATLEHVSISRTQTAVLAAGSSTVSIVHSTANGNGSGFVAAYGPTAELHMDDCTMTNNQWAVVVSGGAKAYVSRSSLFTNFITAMFNDGGSSLISYGDNRFAGNASDGTFTGMASMK